MTGMNKMPNTFTKTNQTQSDQLKVGALKSEFGSMTSQNFKNSDYQ